MAKDYPQLPDFHRVSLKPKWLLPLAVLVLLGATFLTAMYQVPTNSVAVIQRFGAYLDTKQPGLHFKLPLGVDRATIVEARRQQKLEFGYGTMGGTNPSQFSESRIEQEAERNMVTGDLNGVVVEWVIQYRVEDAKAFAFNFREPAETLRDLAEAVMREVVGDRTVDEVLTVGRQEMEVASLERLQDLSSKLEMGIRIEQVQLRNVNPPPPVQASFDEVNRAQQEKEQMINQANGEYNRAVPRARGEAEQKVSEAEGYAKKRINEAEGDAARFKAQLAAYLEAPEVTRRRLYLETMQETLAPLAGKVILDDAASGVLPLLNLTPASNP